MPVPGEGFLITKRGGRAEALPPEEDEYTKLLLFIRENRETQPLGRLGKDHAGELLEATQLRFQHLALRVAVAAELLALGVEGLPAVV